jgi:Cu2+-exporting ATPase
LLPVTAHRVVHGNSGDQVTDVAVSQLRNGDILLVRAGEIVPADGDLLDVRTCIDESMLTGESLPVCRGPGERLAAGTINVDAPLHLRVAAVGASTILANIVALLNRAQSERPRITRAADRTASRFLAKVLIGAAVVCAVWSVIDPGRAFGATLAVLVVACPCALSLATLTAVASANAALARRGILVTHADAIEALSKVSRVVFDKTGTLTTGAIRILGCETLGEWSQDRCLKIATALEVASEHPIARAFAASGLGGESATAIHIVTGEGVEGTVNNTRYRIGSARFVSAAFDAGDAVNKNYEAAIVLGNANGPLAAFVVGDEPRPESARAIAALETQGLGVEILSGDASASVARVAQHCGVDQYAARQSPADKLDRVRTLTAAGEFVAMVGDGINDAPVLGGSGVSIAMSRGSALALASADLILVGDSLQALPQAFEVARRAQSVIRQNLTWAAGYNLTAMPLAAMGWVPPWLAAIGMSLSSIFVVLNSMRLMRDTPAQRTEYRA